MLVLGLWSAFNSSLLLICSNKWLDQSTVIIDVHSDYLILITQRTMSFVFFAVEPKNANLPCPQRQVVTSNVTRSARKLHSSKVIETKCRRLIHHRSSTNSTDRGQRVLPVTTRSGYRRTSLQIDSCLAFQSALPPTVCTSLYDHRRRTGHDHPRSRPPYFIAALCVVNQSLASSMRHC